MKRSVQCSIAALVIASAIPLTASANPHINLRNCTSWNMDVTTYNGDDHVRLMGYDSGTAYAPYNNPLPALESKNEVRLDCKGGGHHRCYVKVTISSGDPNNPTTIYAHYVGDETTLRFVQVKVGGGYYLDNKSDACPATLPN